MGYIQHKDGLCKECGQFSTHFCDACGLYICEEHTLKGEVPNTAAKAFIMCKGCKEEGKKPVNPQSKFHDHSYTH